MQELIQRFNNLQKPIYGIGADKVISIFELTKGGPDDKRTH
jgi:hypothetical protein